MQLKLWKVTGNHPVYAFCACEGTPSLLELRKLPAESDPDAWVAEKAIGNMCSQPDLRCSRGLQLSEMSSAEGASIAPLSTAFSFYMNYSSSSSRRPRATGG